MSTDIYILLYTLYEVTKYIYDSKNLNITHFIISWHAKFMCEHINWMLLVTCFAQHIPFN